MSEEIKRIGDYEILSELGAGGMGRVYKVRNTISDRIEAMKILLPDLAGREELAARFLREIKLLASLNHPNIAQLRTAFANDNQLVMIMEYVAGVSMSIHLSGGPIAVTDAINYIDQVLNALSYAHQLNVIHRDIKPGNMMLTPQGVVKVMDFGIARSDTDLTLTLAGTSLGTVNYMSPEQVKGEPTDARSDLYSVGICLYEMVTGKKAFDGRSRAVLIATLCAMAESHLQLQTPEAGDDSLEDFIEHHPTDLALPIIFEKLDQVYHAERQPSSQELSRWANDPAQPRRSLAQWYLARTELRAGRQEAALRAYTKLRQDRAQFPALAEGLFEFAQFEIGRRHFDEALAILNDAITLHPGPLWSERLALLAGRAQYLARHFDKAGHTFEQVADTSPRLRRDSLFNASLAWLQENDNDRFLADTKALAESGATDETRADLLLEEGLTQAAQGNSKAAQTVESFVRQFPRHKRAAEAWVTLAELAFHAAPPRFNEARKHLERARSSEPDAAATERMDYLTIWIEDAAPDSDAAKIISAATEFLRKYPSSSFISDVRMKLAETYYRRQDFPNAQTHFQILAQENPRGPFTERALFFAAKSATQSMATQSLDRALVLLDEVVKKNGELKWAARNEQAAIERKLGKNQDAATLYDEVLQGNAKPEEKREALCGKGDIFYEAGEANHENYRRAIEMYDQLAAQKDAPVHWRNQALFKKGICLEKLGDREKALATFYKIIEEENRPDRPQREFFWYYKAGFNAARLLEDDSKWQPAAVVYQKLASAAGVRSDEAKSRLSRLRLEHFLWEQ